MSCLGDCLDLGPPPDSILFMPPPPIPSFFRHDLPPFNSTSCLMAASQLCDTSGSSSTSSMTTSLNQAPPERGDYVELPRKDMEWTGIGDTWLLVLVVSSIGVLLLGALLAMFLLKCREMNMFGNPDCSVHRQMKNHHHHHHEPRDCTSITNINASNKVPHPSDGTLYHGGGGTNDANRMVWATLTPRGTQHFIAENYPPDLMDYGGEGQEDHYETVDTVAPAAYYPKDYDYEDPTPLIESYQRHVHDELLEPQYQDMRCSSLNHTLRRNLAGAVHQVHHQVHRPRVSSPTRIEHPNLPPLNLHPHNKGGNTLKRNQGNGYRAVEGGSTLPKYGL